MKFRGILFALSFVSLLALVASAQAGAGETSQTTTTWQTVTTWEMTITTSKTTIAPSVDLVALIEQFAISVARVTFVYVLSTAIGLLIVVTITKGYQKLKDGSPSKTPSTMKSYH